MSPRPMNRLVPSRRLFSLLLVSAGAVFARDPDRISSGDGSHALIIREDGNLYGTGSSGNNELPTGSTSSLNIYRPATVLNSWRHTVAMNQGGIAIRSDSTLWGWGRGSDYAFGNNSTANLAAMTQLGTDRWLFATASKIFSNRVLAIRGDSTLWAWGHNSDGQLGDGTTTTRPTPVQIGSSKWLDVSNSYTHTLAIRADSTLWAWGNNGDGQLGNGNTTNSSVPVQAGTAKWIQVSAGDRYSLGIRADSTLWGWGDDWCRGTGLGTGARYNTPQQVGSAKWRKLVAPMHQVGMGLQADSSLWSWGNNASQLGQGGGASATPGRIGSSKWRDVGGGRASFAGVDAAGLYWAWGNSSLGAGNTGSSNVPVRIFVPGRLDQTIDFNGLFFKKVGDADFDPEAEATSGLPVTYGSSDTSLAKVVAGKIRFIATGNATITAYQDGDSNYNAAPNRTSTFIIQKGDQTITFNAPPAKIVGDADFDPGATASSGLAISYTSSDTMVAKMVGSNLRVVGEGTSDIKASQPGNAGFNSASDVTRTLTVNAIPVGLPAGGAPPNPTRISSGGGLAFIIREDGNLYGTGNDLRRLTGLETSTNNLYLPASILNSWKHVAAADNGGLAVRNDGGLWAWGNGYGYIFGNNSSATLDTLTRIGSDNWIYITTGKINQQTLGIRGDSTLWAWGQNWDGQLGDGSTSERRTPVQVGSAKWVQVSSAYTHTLAIRDDGTMWGWGNNGDGQIGNGNTTNSSVPVQAGVHKWLQVSAADRYSLGIRGDSTLWAWGDGWCGGTGLGNSNRYARPQQVGSAKWIKIVSPLHQVSVALRADSTLWSWGSFGGSSQLGLGDLSNARVLSPTQIGTGKWRDVGGGRDAFAALDVSGQYWAWGQSGLGAGNTYNSNVPVRIDVPGRLAQTINFSSLFFKKMGDADFDPAATATSGLTVTYGSSDTALAKVVAGKIRFVAAGNVTITAYQEGNSTFSAAPNRTSTLIIQKGDQTLTFNTPPAKIVGDADFDPGATASSGLAITYTSSDTMVAKMVGSNLRLVGEGTSEIKASQPGNADFNSASDVTQTLTVNAIPVGLPAGGIPPNPTRISSGSNGTFIIREDGNLYGTGNDLRRLTGLETSTNNLYLPASILNSWKHVAATDNGGLAVRNDGGLWAWGNGYGNIFGNNSSATLETLTRIGSDNWIYITTGKINQQTLGIRTDSTLWAWGQNGNGQLGDGSASERQTPVQVGSAKWAQVSSAYTHTLGIRDDGTLWGWGDNGDGQIGNGNTTGSNVPVQAGVHKWLQVSAADRYSLGIRGDSTLWAWGDGWCGGTGLGNSNRYSRPQQVGSAKWIKLVSPLHQVSIALRADSTLWAWGSFGGANQLGLGELSSARVLSPTQIGTGKWRDVGGGRAAFAALDASGKYWAWGQNALGAGDTYNSNVPVPINVPGNTPVAKADQSITFAALPAVAFGDSAFTLSATASSGLSLTFASSDVSVATISGSTVTIVGAGSTAITASQGGNDSYASASQAHTLVVNKAAQGTTAFTLGADTLKTVGDPAFRLQGVSGSGLTLTFSSSDTTVAKIAGDSVWIRKAGVAAITASQSGDANHLAAPDIVRTLRVRESLPASHAASELSPRSPASLMDTEVELSWTGKIAATGYRIQVAYDTSASSLLLDTVVADTAFTLHGLDFGAKAYWRVAAVHATGQAGFSPYVGFQVRPEPPRPMDVARIPVIPPGNAGTTVEIVLPKVENATGYHLQAGPASQGSIDSSKPLLLDTVVAAPVLSLTGLAPGGEYAWRVAPVNGPSRAPFTPWLTLKVREKEDGSVTRGSVIDSAVKEEVKVSGLVGLTPKDNSLSDVKITLTENKTAPANLAAGFKPLTGRIDLDARTGSVEVKDDQLTLTLNPPDTSLDGKAVTADEMPLVYMIDSVTGELEVVYDLPRDSAGRIVLPLSKGKSFILAVDTLPPVIKDNTPPILHQPGTKPTVTGVVEDNIKNSRGWLKFRQGGADRFDSATVFIDSTGRFELPLAFKLDSTGFEYHLVAMDGRNRVATARTDMSVEIMPMQSPDSLPHLQWRLFAPPTMVKDIRWAEVAAHLGKYKRDWKLFERGPEGLREFGPNLEKAVPGTAYWLKTRSKHFLPSIPGGVATMVNTPFEIVLPPGSWRSFGNPYLFPVSWQSVLDSSTGAPGALAGPYTYRDTSWISPLEIPALEPWEGYYAHNSSPDTIRLRIPSLKARNAEPLLAQSGFHLQWVVRSADGKEAGNLFGTLPPSAARAKPGAGAAPKASGSEAMWRAPKPESPESPFHAGFPDGAENGRLLQTDFRALGAAGGSVWTARLSGLRPGQRYAHRLLGADALPDGVMVALADPATGSFIPWNDGLTHVVETQDGEQARDLLFYAGSPDYVNSRGAEFAAANPFSIELRNYPNPVRGFTVVNYAVPASAAGRQTVGLAVHDMQGRIVRMLVEGPQTTGRYSLRWDARDGRGNALAAGSYQLVLKVGARRMNRSLQLLP